MGNIYTKKPIHCQCLNSVFKLKCNQVLLFYLATLCLGSCPALLVLCLSAYLFTLWDNLLLCYDSSFGLLHSCKSANVLNLILYFQFSTLYHYIYAQIHLYTQI